MTENTEHPILCLWCHPRSMSTAIERIMRERGDFECFHEPFMYDYYVHRKVSDMPHFDSDHTAPVSYADIKNMLLEAAQQSPVFIKDMSYYIVPQLFHDKEFAGRLTHSFLIRHPMHSILSYFKLDNAVTLEEIGIEAQWKHARWLHQELGIQPLVLSAETIRENTKGVISQYWRQLGLDVIEQAFEWNQEHAPQDWQQVAGWHNKVSESRGIRKTNQASDIKRQREFDSLSKEHPKLKDFLKHHLPFYEKLKAISIQA